MLDTIIRGGLIVDGTGSPGTTGDVGVCDGKIVSVGERISEYAKETIDADGAIITPGFIDFHTHYDGQIFWDDTLDPSFSAGITTILGGNCGVGFAPLRSEYRKELIEMMEGVEDIPGLVLDEGLDWNWESFPDYLDRIAERKFTMDVGLSIAHAPLRVYVMGERALRHENATDNDITIMAGLVRDAMAAGAAGFSSGRTLEHKSSTGEMIPGTVTEERELLQIARAMGAKGAGVFQMVPKGASGNNFGNGISPKERLAEYHLMANISTASGRPLTYVLLQDDSDPDWWLEAAYLTDSFKAQGADLRPQISARQTTLFIHLDGYHPFRCRPTYLRLQHLPRSERAAAMRDPATKAAILVEDDVSVEMAPSPAIHHFAHRFCQNIGQLYILDYPIDYEPDETKLVGNIAVLVGKSGDEIIYDLLSEGSGNRVAVEHVHNYTRGNLQDTYNLMQHPSVLSGLADGGAHLGISCDAAMPAFQLSFWGRDRQRGPRMPIETIVKNLSADGAEVYGLGDRGLLAPGKRADINVIDMDNISVDIPELVFDLPSGGPRFIQRSHGYVATLVNGTTTRRNDIDLGLRPGRLIRSGR